jgi:hypothetical protein
MQEAVAAFEAAPKEQPISDMHVVIAYTARVERVRHFTRAGEHVFEFTRLVKDGEYGHERWEQLGRNAHAVRDEFLRVKHPIEALDFLSNAGLFSPLNDWITWSEFQRWQRFAELVQLHTPLATATNEAQFSGECAEILKALTGDSIFRSSFFDGCKIPKTAAQIESETIFSRTLNDDPELRSAVEKGRQLQASMRRELLKWFHQPPLSIEWIPSSEEAERRAMQHLQNRGFGPWMMEFLLPKEELRPVILIKPKHALQAIAAAIYADRIHGVEWRKCKWRKCPETFRVGAMQPTGKNANKKQEFCIGRPCREDYRSDRKRHPRKDEAE